MISNMGILAIIVLIAAIAWYNILQDKREADKAKAKAEAVEEASRTMPLTDSERDDVLNNFYGEKSETEMEKTENNVHPFKYNTRGLFIEILKKIGCQYEIDKEDNRILFAYQGEHFVAETTEEGLYVHIWDTHWGHVELYDIDEFTRLRKAINTANLNCATMTVYTIDEDAKTVDVHCKSTFPFLPQMPDLGNYLRGELNGFFRAHQLVGNEMTKLREKEEAVES